jgi:putative transcriptional regulator
MPGRRKTTPVREESASRVENAAVSLEPPILLVAMPQVLDPFFNMSVVLLVQHQAEGSQGFIVNRPTAVPLGDILEGLEIAWGGDPKQTAHFGGPVQPQLGTVIFRSDAAPASPSQHEVCSGVLLTQNVHDLQSLAEHPPDAMRLLLGYAGWGEGQLMQEILRNDWMAAPFSLDLVFAEDPGETWRRALESVGVDPAQLPTWMPGDNNEMAN